MLASLISLLLVAPSAGGRGADSLVVSLREADRFAQVAGLTQDQFAEPPVRRFGETDASCGPRW